MNLLTAAGTTWSTTGGTANVSVTYTANWTPPDYGAGPAPVGASPYPPLPHSPMAAALAIPYGDE